MTLNSGSFPETRVNTFTNEPLVRVDDCIELYKSFIGLEPSGNDLLSFASTSLDFRNGRSRESTPWREGEALSTSQKEAIINLADKWGMLRTTYPQKSFDRLVVLGAHRDSLKLRMKHAANILMTQENKDRGLVLLSCYRPLLTQEGAEGMDTEYDLAIKLAEEEFNGRFISSSSSCWEDLANDTNQAIGEYAVAALGRISGRDIISISGSVPGGSIRATTASTLMSLQSLLESSQSRLLFVTTSLHLPYQRVQIQKILSDFNSEIVGVEYVNLSDITLDTEDYKFRIILQEIGATIKNILSDAQDIEKRTSASV